MIQGGVGHLTFLLAEWCSTNWAKQTAYKSLHFNIPRSIVITTVDAKTAFSNDKRNQKHPRYYPVEIPPTATMQTLKQT